MGGKDVAKIPDKMTDAEKKKAKQANKAKANPALAAKNLASADAKRERRGKAPLGGGAAVVDACDNDEDGGKKKGKGKK